ncbi:MAG TPA: hypothetical protein VHU91_05335 [Mycobacteriales bacterium]|nr:hypothetical protein [Mycobacteriales bacterium]
MRGAEVNATRARLDDGAGQAQVRPARGGGRTDEPAIPEDSRIAADSSLVSISPEPPLIDVWGTIALVRHYFEVTLTTVSGTELIRVRNTSVWREIAGRWMVVHNHEDAIDLRARPTIEGGKSPD